MQPATAVAKARAADSAEVLRHMAGHLQPEVDLFLKFEACNELYLSLFRSISIYFVNIAIFTFSTSDSSFSAG